MNKAVVNLSIVAVKKEASHSSELVNQLLFGDIVEIISVENNWSYIKSEYDNYNGYVLSVHLKIVTDEQYIDIINKNKFVVDAYISQINEAATGVDITLFAGTTLALNADNTVVFGDEVYTFDDEISKPFLNIDSLIESAKMFLNTPYLWGGRSFAGIDCSGFTQIIFKIQGIKLLRDAWQQAEQGETINFISEAIAGDLLFFDNAEGKITHVGIYLGANEIIHSSGKVRIDTIDHQGIYNKDVKDYTHQLRLIKRMF